MTLDTNFADKIQSAMRRRHMEWARRGDLAPRGEPNTIGRVAAKLTKAYYRGRYTGEAATRELVNRCAGNLVYAMDCYGLNFEGICDIAEIRVAQVVSGLSPDITLPHGLRRQAAKSKLVEAQVDCQIVRLAEIYCAAKRVQDTYGPADLKLHAEALHRWAEDAEELFDGLSKLRASKEPGIQAVLVQTKAMIIWVGRAGNATLRPPRPAPAAAGPPAVGAEGEAVPAGDLRVANPHFAAAAGAAAPGDDDGH